MTAGPGHNGGPAMAGVSWRKHCWTAARERLLPTLPIEVVRLRVNRAKELGLDYRTYAGIRATTGQDLVAFLFSSNALRVIHPRPMLAPDRAARLAAIGGAARIGLAVAPLRADLLAQLAPELDAAFAAPAHLGRFPEARALVRAAIGRMPSDAVLLVGDHPLEAEWCAAGRLAGYLSADRFFGT